MDCATQISSLLARGRLGEAGALLRRGLGHEPENARLHFLQGELLRREGNMAAAVRELERAVAIDPSFYQARCNLGAACTVLGDFHAAVTHLRAATALRPASPVPCNNLGAALAALGRFEEAIQAYSRALEHGGDNPEIFNNLGKAWQEQGDPDRAEAWFRRACAASPAHRDALYNLGNILRTKNKLDEAAAMFERGLAGAPDSVEIMNNLAECRLVLGDVDGAEQWYRRALGIQPARSSVRSGLLVCLNYRPGLPWESLRAEHRTYGRFLSSPPRDRTGPPRRAGGRPPAIGVVSPDFRAHPAGYFLLGWLMHRRRDRFRLFCYSDAKKGDAMTERFRALADEWRDCSSLSNGECASLVRSDGISILVECAGHSAANRLEMCAVKPAPVQASWLGYPNTTGLPAMDYRLSDPVADPPGNEAMYTERLIRIEGCFCCYAPPGSVPDVGPLPMARNGFCTFGSLHHLARLNGSVLDLWARVLHAVPDSRLLIVRNTLTPEAIARCTADLHRRGIAPERVTLRPDALARGHHLAWYRNDIDISLDTFPWSGHTTACESLWMGVPFITLPGRRFASRMVASVLTAAGLEEWIAGSPESYVETAASLARDPGTLREVRKNLRERIRTSDLCNGPRFARRMEETLLGLWEKHGR